MTKLNSLQAPFSDVPCNRFFELELLSRRDDHAEIRMPVKVAYVQEKGVIHGGIITTLADTAAVYAINPDLPPGKTMTSIELKVNFLRVAVCRVDVLQSEKAVATGIFTYLILPTTS
jgi:uncharacterized protein (TIGR00369 family)